jgi:hypothetical protein
MIKCDDIIIFVIDMNNVEIGKVDAKKRKVFKDSKDRTYVKQGDKKVYVKKLFTPKRNTPASPEMPVVINRGPGLSPMINIKKVNAKKRKVFQDSKGRTYVKPDGKKIYVKKLFTPPRSTAPVIPTVPARSPVVNTEKVNAKGRKVFKDSKGRTHVKQGDKKVYVKKLFTPKRNAPAINPRERPRKAPPRKLLQPSIVPRVSADCSTAAGLRQVSMTCWFNATLNGFVLGEATAKMLFDKIKLLSSTEIVELAKDFPTDSCPITLSRKYVFHYFMKIHSDYPVIGKKGNISVNLMNKMFTPKALASPIAKGRAGGYPLDAARQILRKVFNIDETGLLRKWETVFPNHFRNHTMIYSDGPAVPDKMTPDMHPLVVNTKDKKTRFHLSHVVYIMERKNGNHAVVAYVCGGKEYVYDSNNPRRLEIEWSDPENREKLLEYSDAIKFKVVSYCLYVRE